MKSKTDIYYRFCLFSYVPIQIVWMVSVVLKEISGYLQFDILWNWSKCKFLGHIISPISLMLFVLHYILLLYNCFTLFYINCFTFFYINCFIFFYFLLVFFGFVLCTCICHFLSPCCLVFEKKQLCLCCNLRFSIVVVKYKRTDLDTKYANLFICVFARFWKIWRETHLSWLFISFVSTCSV